MTQDILVHATTAVTMASVLLLVYAALFDLQTYRIPNKVSGAMLGLGFVIAGLRAAQGDGWIGFAWDLGAAALLFRILYLIWVLPELPAMTWRDALRIGPDALLLREMQSAVASTIIAGRLLNLSLQSAWANLRGRPAPETTIPSKTSPAEAGFFFGGGDVKLLSAAALAVGTEGLFAMLIVTAIAGGVLVVLFGLRNCLIRLAAQRGLLPAPDALRHVAYGPAIAAGTIVALLAPTAL